MEKNIAITSKIAYLYNITLWLLLFSIVGNIIILLVSDGAYSLTPLFGIPLWVFSWIILLVSRGNKKLDFKAFYYFLFVLQTIGAIYSTIGNYWSDTYICNNKIMIVYTNGYVNGGYTFYEVKGWFPLVQKKLPGQNYCDYDQILRNK